MALCIYLCKILYKHHKLCSDRTSQLKELNRDIRILARGFNHYKKCPRDLKVACVKFVEAAKIWDNAIVRTGLPSALVKQQAE